MVSRGWTDDLARGTEYTKTIDGIEQHFAINHLAPFLFTNLIMELIIAAGPGARIINVASRGHAVSDIRYDDYNWEVSLCKFARYLKNLANQSYFFFYRNQMPIKTDRHMVNRRQAIFSSPSLSRQNSRKRAYYLSPSIQGVL